MLDFERKYYVFLREGRKFKDIDTNSDIGTGLQRKGDNSVGIKVQGTR